LILNGTTSLSAVGLGAILSLLGHTLGVRVVPLAAAVCVIAAIGVFRRYPGTAPRPAGTVPA
jgi:hypothetical protein